MEPESAISEIGEALKKLFSVLGADASTRFLIDLLDEPGNDKVASMVHL